ncbi:MAG TPA: GGDEF domain-containing protein [Kofleriaceae bacterium]|nr:GGDEF domain-containing protein [Kofleriaceae bacterium]
MGQPPDVRDEDSMVTAEKPTSPAVPVGGSHACLTVLTGTAAGQMFRIPEGHSVIGRSSSSHLRIDEEGVSRSHARIRREGSSIAVDDLGSRNGTFVNGERVTGPRPLDEGDKIQIGPLTMLRYAHHDEIDERFHQRLVASALRDPLTRLFNKRYLLDRLDCELRFARRHVTSLSMLMLDLDRFKDLNDRHGLLAGDAVLAHLASVLQKAVRNEDVVARFGGEELAVVLRSGGLDQATALGERLRRLAETTPTRYRGLELAVTISIGVAGYPSTRAETVEQLVEAAEGALLRAKREGRNRVSR